jgi:hypothetical protein
VTEKEKLIYNTYLIVSRSQKNQPFKIRKDFTKLDNKTNFIIKKLYLFFSKYSHIDIKEFFTAPYEMYTQDDYIPLNFYITRKAIKLYTLFKQKQEELSPDKQIEEIKKSFQYIGSFCLKNKILLEDYLHHKTGCIYTWMLHYKEHYINVYSLFELGDICKFLTEVSTDEKDILLNNLHNNIAKFKTRYYNSTSTKIYVKQATDSIKKFLKTN